MSAAFCHYAFLLTILLVCCVGCGEHRSNTILASQPSPDGKLKAVVFERDSAAATGASRNVSIIPSSENVPKSGGNVYITAAKAGISVIWLDNTHLKIVIHGKDTVSIRKEAFQGLTITYEEPEDAQPDGPANGSQPIRSDTNRTSSAAGSRR
jgi:hypothetical protein